MKVKIIASNPKDGQAGIQGLIGRIFEASDCDPENGTVAVFASEFGGLIRLQPSEFKKVPELQEDKRIALNDHHRKEIIETRPP